MTPPKYYAVANGRQTGIFNDWDSCKGQVNGYSGARYKSFSSSSEAQQFIDSHNRGGGGSSYREYSGMYGNPASSTDSYYTSSSLPQKSPNNVVYTDGACSNNGTPLAKAGYGVYWGDGNPNNISEPLPEGEPQTNNRAEYTAVKEAMKQAIDSGLPEVTIRTDSELFTKSMNQWHQTWEKNGYKTADGKPVANQDLVKEIKAMREQIEVKFEHVPGHSGNHGNEMADKLARAGANNGRMKN